MNNLLALAARWKHEADDLLRDSHLDAILAECGELQYTGSYAYDVMLGADIDIYVIQPSDKAKDTALVALHKLIEQNYWNGYLYYDFAAHSSSYHPEFPAAYYLGVKGDFGGHRWKVDVWFGEREMLNNENNAWIKDAMTDAHRETILRLKLARDEGIVQASSHAMYDAVIRHGIKTVDQFTAWQQR